MAFGRKVLSTGAVVWKLVLRTPPNIGFGALALYSPEIPFMEGRSIGARVGCGVLGARNFYRRRCLKSGAPYTPINHIS